MTLVVAVTTTGLPEKPQPELRHVSRRHLQVAAPTGLSPARLHNDRPGVLQHKRKRAGARIPQWLLAGVPISDERS